MAVSGDPQAPASSLAKPELRPQGSQSGDWEPAQNVWDGVINPVPRWGKVFAQLKNSQNQFIGIPVNGQVIV